MDNNDQLQKLVDLITEQNKLISRLGLLLSRVTGYLTFYFVITIIAIALWILDFILRI